MPTEGKRTGNTVMAGMRWEWEEEVVELPTVEGLFRIEVRAHATGEFVDDTRAATQTDRAGAHAQHCERLIGATRSPGPPPSLGVVGSARSDMRDAVGRADRGQPAVRQSAGQSTRRSATRITGCTCRAQDIGTGKLMRTRGFTLIEVVIAMFIAAIMFAIGYGAINQALLDRDALNVSQERVTEIQRGMRVVAQDFAQVVPRGARDTVGYRAS